MSTAFSPSKRWIFIIKSILIYLFVFQVVKGEVALSAIQRNQVYVALNEKVLVEAWMPRERNVYAQNIRIEVDYLTKGKEVC